MLLFSNRMLQQLYNFTNLYEFTKHYTHLFELKIMSFRCTFCLTLAVGNLIFLPIAVFALGILIFYFIYILHCIFIMKYLYIELSLCDGKMSYLSPYFNFHWQYLLKWTHQNNQTDNGFNFINLTYQRCPKIYIYYPHWLVLRFEYLIGNKNFWPYIYAMFYWCCTLVIAINYAGRKFQLKHVYDFIKYIYKT